MGYFIFYGNIISEGPLSYKIVTSDNEFIEEFKIGEYFMKYYPIKGDKGTKILPIIKK